MISRTNIFLCSKFRSCVCGGLSLGFLLAGLISVSAAQVLERFNKPGLAFVKDPQAKTDPALLEAVEIYKSKTNATARIIRAGDGAIVYSSTVQSVDGQAITDEKAVIDGLLNAAAAMAEKLTEDLGAIDEALLGEGQ